MVFAVATLTLLGKFNPSDRDMNYLREKISLNRKLEQCQRQQPWTFCLQPISYNHTTTYHGNIKTIETRADNYAAAWGELVFCLAVMTFLIASKLKVREHPAL